MSSGDLHGMSMSSGDLHGMAGAGAEPPAYPHSMPYAHSHSDLTVNHGLFDPYGSYDNVSGLTLTATGTPPSIHTIHTTRDPSSSGSCGNPRPFTPSPSSVTQSTSTSTNDNNNDNESFLIVKLKSYDESDDYGGNALCTGGGGGEEVGGLYAAMYAAKFSERAAISDMHKPIPFPQIDVD